jgi:hypothetical protein
MTPYRAEVARFVRHLMISLEYPDADRSDIRELSSRLKRMPSDDALASLVFIVASKALRWAVFDHDHVNVINLTNALVKALKQDLRQTT